MILPGLVLLIGGANIAVGRTGRASRKAARGRPEKKVPRHSFELKRKAVRLYLEEGFSAEDIAAETGISIQTLRTWVRLYREFGEEGLKPKALSISAPVIRPGTG